MNSDKPNEEELATKEVKTRIRATKIKKSRTQTKTGNKTSTREKVSK